MCLAPVSVEGGSGEFYKQLGCVCFDLLVNSHMVGGLRIRTRFFTNTLGFKLRTVFNIVLVRRIFMFAVDPQIECVYSEYLR